MNAAERAIQMFKNHFLAGLAAAHADFPLQLWCELLVQAETTLNLLRKSRVNEKKSACEVSEGKFDCNKTPIHPPGQRALVSNPAKKRATWAPHCSDGWCLGPAMKHCRCGRHCIPSTRCIRISASAKTLPSHATIPALSENDKTLLAAKELLEKFKEADALEHGEKLKHIKAIKQLTDTIENAPPSHKTTDERPQRVDTPTTSVNLTEPQAVKKMKLIHQRKTRTNTPMPGSIEEEEDKGVQRVSQPTQKK